MRPLLRNGSPGTKVKGRADNIRPYTRGWDRLRRSDTTRSWENIVGAHTMRPAAPPPIPKPRSLALGGSVSKKAISKGLCQIPGALCPNIEAPGSKGPGSRPQGHARPFLLPFSIPSLGVPMTGRGIAPLVPKVWVDAVPHIQGAELASDPAGIMPAKVLAGLTGLFLFFHEITSFVSK